MIIASNQNPQIKNILKLYQKKHRDQTGTFLVEGHREITRALENNLKLLSLYVSSEKKPLPTDHTLIEPNLFSKISYRQNPDGYLAIFQQPTTKLLNIDPNKQDFLIILVSPEKPGNLGADTRNTHAVNASAIIVCDPTMDIFNPNVIRASSGVFFSKPIYQSDSKTAIDLLTQNNYQIICSTPHTTKKYNDIKNQKPLALVMGPEDKGLDKNWLNIANQKIMIPMLGQADSLNLSVSTGIICYEILRQSNTQK